MWHGKSAISRATGYTQGRMVRRGGQDSSIRMSDRAEAGMGAITLIGLALFVGFILIMIGGI